MIVLELEQGSQEWLQARAGVITASRAKDATEVLKKTGEPTDKALRYAAQVAMERVAGVPCDDTFVNFAMQRGSELEPQARQRYEIETGQTVYEGGIVLTDDRRLGYSADGFIGLDGLVEIKAPLSPLTVIRMWQTGDVSDYIHQIQMGLWITGRRWCDFIMYDPRLAVVGKDLYVKRIERDEAFIEKLEQDLLAAMRRVDEFEAVLRAGSEPVAVEVAAVKATVAIATASVSAAATVEAQVTAAVEVFELVGGDDQRAQPPEPATAGAGAPPAGTAAPTIQPIAEPAPAAIKLGALNKRFGFTMTEAFIRDLGIHVHRDGRAVLIAERDIAALKAALIRHVEVA